MIRRNFLISASAALFLGSVMTVHAADHTVAIKDFAFEPASLTVATGDTVTFTNEDGAPHTGTALDGSFDTGRLNKGESGSVTISGAGTFDFKCNFHPNMTGSITAQ